MQGIIRHIEQDSNADAAYDTSFGCAVTGGFGYFRIVTEYEDEKSFDQVIKIKTIKNPLSVYLDPAAQEVDGSDANWGFIADDYSALNFKKCWPNSKLAASEEWTSVGASAPGWVSKDGCRVVEYFYRDFVTKTLVKLSNGVIDFSDEMLPEKELEAGGLSIADTRQVSAPVVKWCKTNGIEILEKTEWLGKWIPIIPVYGDELNIDGKRILEGIIRHAKDPQRMSNYWASAETETIALAPRAPYIGAEGQFEGHETEWAQANTRNFAYLQYKPKSLGGDMLPPPQRNTYEPATAAITQARMQANDDLKATTGIYDPSLGNRSNERSGKAILARQNQSNTGNFHFVDNLARALKFACRQLVDLIPKVYDGPRVLRIIGEDGEPSTATVNQEFDVNGVKKIYNLGIGRYDIIPAAGPSYATKREQAVQTMLDMTQSFPQLVQIAGDLMVKNMDWPGAVEIAARLRKALPPGLADDGPQDKNKQIPPEVAQHLQQSDQMIEQLTAALNEATEKVKGKQMEIDSKERIAQAEIASNELLKKLEIASAEKIAHIQESRQALTTQAELKSDEAQHALAKAAEVHMHERTLEEQPEPTPTSAA